MNTQKIAASLVGIAATATLLLGALPAAAQTNASSTTASSTTLATIISKGNADIAARLTALAALNTRVQAMKNESDAEKANISAQVQANTSGLTALQTKLDADTTVAAARTDSTAIFTTFRIYALAIPQGFLLATADRITTIGSMMTALGEKFQTRITAAQTAGKDVTALTAALTDMNAKIADATTQSAAIKSGVSGLVPDQGSATVIASNKAALIAARGNAKTAETDFKAARADISTILKGLKALGPVASSTPQQ